MSNDRYQMSFARKDMLTTDFLEEEKYNLQEIKYHLRALILSLEECRHHLNKIHTHDSLLKKDLHKELSHV